jgi:uncharacterized membrane protein
LHHLRSVAVLDDLFTIIFTIGGLLLGKKNMYLFLKKSFWNQETIFLFMLTCTCFALSIFRIMLSNSNRFIFLNWNLFLAFLPWLLTQIVLLKSSWQQNKFILFSVLSAWLLFFPNAPYILTDLFHLRLRSPVPLWFDLVLILSFAWTGLLFGFLSLLNIEKILAPMMRTNAIRIISIALLFVGSFGIYLGRYLRWNSWDIVTEPKNLIVDIGDRLINPLHHLTTWGVTFGMFIFLNMLYWSFRLFLNKK